MVGLVCCTRGCIVGLGNTGYLGTCGLCLGLGWVMCGLGGGFAGCGIL